MSRPPFTAPLQLGDRELLLSPLSFEALEDQAAAIHAMAEGGFPSAREAFAAMTALILASAQRRHPELTAAALKPHLDWPSAQAYCTEVLRLSFPQPAPGEIPAGSPSGSSTGTAPSPS